MESKIQEEVLPVQNGENGVANQESKAAKKKKKKQKQKQNKEDKENQQNQIEQQTETQQNNQQKQKENLEEKKQVEVAPQKTDVVEDQNANDEEKKKKKKKKNKKKKSSMDDIDKFLEEAKRENDLLQEKEQKSQQNAQKDLKINSNIPSNCPLTQDQIKNIKKERFQDNSLIRRLNNWSEGETKQTNPPTIPIDNQFPNGVYPKCTMQEYKNDKTRISSQDNKTKEILMNTTLENLRKGAETHKQVRKYAQSIIKPGVRLIDVCEQIEEMNRYLIGENGIKAGIGFPTGVSLNNIAAHWTPNNGDYTTVEYNDLCKVDFGCQIEGKIIDCAFTVGFNPMFDNLIQATQEATAQGIKESGIDVRLGDIGAAIQEVMESYEVEINGKIYPVKSIKNLNGHLIGDYQIHGGKSVPIIKTQNNQKMEEGELYAIETFGSTGKATVYEDLDTSHYMRDFHQKNVPLRHPKAKPLLKFIEQNFGTLAFCRRWLDRGGQTGHLIALKNLVEAGLVNPYPPLCDIPGSYVAQTEHTFILKPTCLEILSKGEDF